ncbi:hypothetical protein L1049_005662 [Liquidambar formosana]|uniref:F-box domain-containing protein n=1 Tax=Liquidambar formosana TaxID=63359 RepID=A0AAP0WRX0_LIQFO
MTRDCKRKADGNPTSDIISGLPGNIIKCILGRLPIRDAVRTSILSRKWRYNWIILPQLVFDKRFFKVMGKDREFKLHEFRGIASKLLLFQSGPILKFVLHVPIDYSVRILDIGQWIFFL